MKNIAYSGLHDRHLNDAPSPYNDNNDTYNFQKMTWLRRHLQVSYLG